MSLYDSNLDILRRLDPALVDKLRELDILTDNKNCRQRISRETVSLEISLKGTNELLLGQKPEMLGAFTPHSSPLDTDKKSDIWIGHEHHEDTDCHIKLLLEELRGNLVRRIDADSSTFTDCQQQYTAVILLGAPCLIRLIEIIRQRKPLLVIGFYMDAKEWNQWLGDSNLANLENELVKYSGRFQTQITKAPILAISKAIREDLLGCVGNSLILANGWENNYLEVIHAIRDRYLPILRPTTGGPCVDELMMLKHSHINIHSKSIQLLQRVRFKTNEPIIVVGSGPSLDGSLGIIESLANQCHIISAGSSIKTLFRHNIRPDFHVHVERGGNDRIANMYRQILAESGTDTFGQTIGVVPSSIEPQLQMLYERVILYAREGQSPIANWPGLENHVLYYEGPQCVSAAFAFATHLQPSEIYLFGCDLGSVSPEKLRSSNAAGNANRIFTKVVHGNLSPRVATNAEISQQIPFMQAALRSCASKPHVYNSSDGVELLFATPRPLYSYGSLSTSKHCSSDELFQIASVQATNLDNFFTRVNVLEGETGCLDWIHAWINLSRQAIGLPMPILRIKASQLLKKPANPGARLSFKVLSGTIRDGFWLTANAVERVGTTLSDKKECWRAFERTLLSLELEMLNLASIMRHT